MWSLEGGSDAAAIGSKGQHRDSSTATGLLPPLVGSPKPAAHPAPAPCHQKSAITRSPPSASLSVGPGAYMTVWCRRTTSSPRLEVVRDRQRFQFVFMGSSWAHVGLVCFHAFQFVLALSHFMSSFPTFLPKHHPCRPKVISGRMPDTTSTVSHGLPH